MDPKSTQPVAPSPPPAQPASTLSDDELKSATAGPSTTTPSGRARMSSRTPQMNENSLQRRLDCVMAVEAGEMTMAEACAAYDISSRTFYRWLRSKSRLVELTSVKNDSPAPAVSAERATKRPRVGGGEPERTRIEVVSGRRKTVLNWYAGARSDDIRKAISRRFGIDENRWFLNNADNEHVVLSHGIPSGRYHLVPFDELQVGQSSLNAAAAAAAAVSAVNTGPTNTPSTSAQQHQQQQRHQQQQQLLG